MQSKNRNILTLTDNLLAFRKKFIFLWIIRIAEKTMFPLVLNNNINKIISIITLRLM